MRRVRIHWFFLLSILAILFATSATLYKTLILEDFEAYTEEEEAPLAEEI